MSYMRLSCRGDEQEVFASRTQLPHDFDKLKHIGQSEIHWRGCNHIVDRFNFSD